MAVRPNDGLIQALIRLAGNNNRADKIQGFAFNDTKH